MTEHSSIEIIVTQYHDVVGKLWDALMMLEMQLVEQLEV